WESGWHKRLTGQLLRLARTHQLPINGKTDHGEMVSLGMILGQLRNQSEDEAFEINELRLTVELSRKLYRGYTCWELRKKSSSKFHVGESGERQTTFEGVMTNSEILENVREVTEKMLRGELLSAGDVNRGVLAIIGYNNNKTVEVRQRKPEPERD